jgi:hypothetical protein
VPAFWDGGLGKLVKMDIWKKALEQHGWYDAYVDSATFRTSTDTAGRGRTRCRQAPRERDVRHRPHDDTGRAQRRYADPAGLATSGLVLSTTRYAADADYRLFIVEDCCADTDPAGHDFLCTKIFPRQAEVVQSADVIKGLAA